MRAFNQQTLSAAIEAVQAIFQNCVTGTFTSGCGTNLDHGVFAAGYNSNADYYLVKNSWRKSWDNDGYLQIGTSGNVRGITSQPSCSALRRGSAPWLCAVALRRGQGRGGWRLPVLRGAAHRVATG